MMLSKFKPIQTLFLLVALSVSAQLHAALEFTISGGDVDPLPIAIVPFLAPANLPEDVAQVIENDLKRSCLFRPLARNQMLETPSRASKVDFRNWRVLGVDHVVVGEVEPVRGGYLVRFYLMDVLRGEQALAFEMPVATDAGQLRYTAHDVADIIYEKLTGMGGYFNSQIAYITATGRGDNRSFALMVSDADGFNPRTVLRSSEPVLSPSWSPDKSKLAYVAYERGRSGVYVQDRATGAVDKLVSEKGINGAPAWSPDGKKIAVVLSNEKNPDVYVIDLATKQRTRITDHWGIDTEPSWSPDGQTLVFTSDRGGRAQIYSVPSAGGSAKRITFEGKQNLDASYSPDGRYLTMVTNGPGGYRIAILDLERGDFTTLTDGPLDESPSFAPNSRVIIYSKQTGSGAGLATVTTDGRVQQEIRQSGDVREPAWSPKNKVRR